MAHRNKMLAALGLASVLAVASLGHVHAAPYLRSDGILWSAVGSVGEVDPGSVALAKTSRAILSMNAPGTLTVRYSVVPGAELAAASDVVHLMANFANTGAHASVSVALLEVDVDNPAIPKPLGATPSTGFRSLLRMDSAAQESTGFASHCIADGTIRFDFENHAYYIQVVLSWDGAPQTQAPSIRALEIGVYQTVCGK